MLPRLEITTGPDDRPVAGFDLSAAQLEAVTQALGDHRRERFALAELETDEVLALAELREAEDQIRLLEAAGGHGRVELSAAGVRRTAEAVSVYLQREEQGYQPPAVHERLALLRPLLGELLDLGAQLWQAADGGPAPAQRRR